MSSRHLHDLFMCAEHVHVGTTLYALKQAGCTIYELRTDSALYRPPKRRKASILEDLEYKDLHLMRSRLEGEAKRLNEWHDMAASDVAQKLYRIKKCPTEEDQLRCNPKRPSRSCKLIPLGPPKLRNLTHDEAETKVIERRESILVTGAPSTGKTTFLQGIAERLMSLGLAVDIKSKTVVEGWGVI